MYKQKTCKLTDMQEKNIHKNEAGNEIRFVTGKCSLGSILVAFSQRGICSISLGNDPDVLVMELQESFPDNRLIGGSREYEQQLSIIVEYLEHPSASLDLPLDIHGTAFQQRVWRALNDIPVGKTESYSEIAKRIGSPTATRAVARACAANKLAVAIPCHRVVKNDGSLSGYRWGVERKRVLLLNEARVN